MRIPYINITRANIIKIRVPVQYGVWPYACVAAHAFAYSNIILIWDIF